jgi:uncharacterized protein YbjQ (UPF0145 family)
MAAVDSKWLVLASDGEEYPATGQDLRAWILEGRITGENPVREGSKDWIKASLAPPLRGTFDELRRLDELRIANFFMTTETVLLDHTIVRRIEIVSAECAFGMNLFRDLFAGIRDVFGGRSEATQKVLRDARRKVLSELRSEALQVGAHAVIGVDLDYSEFSGGGKSMLFLVANGTAVALKKRPLHPSTRETEQSLPQEWRP